MPGQEGGGGEWAAPTHSFLRKALVLGQPGEIVKKQWRKRGWDLLLWEEMLGGARAWKDVRLTVILRRLLDSGVAAVVVSVGEMVERPLLDLE